MTSSNKEDKARNGAVTFKEAFFAKYCEEQFEAVELDYLSTSPKSKGKAFCSRQQNFEQRNPLVAVDISLFHSVIRKLFMLVRLHHAIVLNIQYFCMHVQLSSYVSIKRLQRLLKILLSVESFVDGSAYVSMFASLFTSLFAVKHQNAHWGGGGGF